MLLTRRCLGEVETIYWHTQVSLKKKWESAVVA